MLPSPRWTNWWMAVRTDRAILLRVLREPAQLLSLDPVARDLVLRQLRRLRLLAHVGGALRRGGAIESLPQSVQDQLVSAATLAQARARLATWELDRLVRALDPGPEFPVVVLKGCAYLLLDLPHARSRQLTDVDLLVPEQNLGVAEAMLRDEGWEAAPLSAYDERYYREWAHEIPPLRHVEREMEVDVHHNILQRTARLKPDAALLLQAAQPAGTAGLSVLCPADMVLHAMTHLFHSSEMDDALRELVDIDALLRHFAAGDAGFWPAFADRATALQLRRPAWYALHYCRRWLGTPVPQPALAAIEPGAPAGLVRAVMDCAVPGALFARHPDRPERGAALARSMLLARTQWIRMPPALLLSHLARKGWSRLQRKGDAAT